MSVEVEAKDLPVRFSIRSEFSFGRLTMRSIRMPGGLIEIRDSIGDYVTTLRPEQRVRIL